MYAHNSSCLSDSATVDCGIPESPFGNGRVVHLPPQPLGLWLFTFTIMVIPQSLQEFVRMVEYGLYEIFCNTIMYSTITHK